MCFLAGVSVDLQVPNQCRRKMEIACSESSFPVNCWNCFVRLLTEVTESLPLLYFFLTSLSLSSLHFLPFSYFISFLYHSYFSPLLFHLFPVDDVPPYFKMEPPQTQVHLEGNRLVLTCMAEGSWPLEFKWIYNGSELTRFSLEYRWGMQPCQTKTESIVIYYYFESAINSLPHEDILVAFSCN